MGVTMVVLMMTIGCYTDTKRERDGVNGFGWGMGEIVHLTRGTAAAVLSRSRAVQSDNPSRRMDES